MPNHLFGYFIIGVVALLLFAYAYNKKNGGKK